MRQIIYFSTAADRQDAVVLAEIVAQSRAHNLRDNVTGLLVAGGHRYLQVIEGSSPVIGRLVKRLRQDQRHLGMSVLVDRVIPTRNFDGWSMAFARQPQLNEFATFGHLVAEMRVELTDAKLRDQLDCFARTFATAPSRLDAPLWKLAANDADDLAVDLGH